MVIVPHERPKCHKMKGEGKMEEKEIISDKDIIDTVRNKLEWSEDLMKKANEEYFDAMRVLLASLESVEEEAPERAIMLESMKDLRELQKKLLEGMDAKLAEAKEKGDSERPYIYLEQDAVHTVTDVTDSLSNIYKALYWRPTSV